MAQFDNSSLYRLCHRATMSVDVGENGQVGCSHLVRHKIEDRPSDVRLDRVRRDVEFLPRGLVEGDVGVADSKGNRDEAV